MASAYESRMYDPRASGYYQDGQNHGAASHGANHYQPTQPQQPVHNQYHAADELHLPTGKNAYVPYSHDQTNPAIPTQQPSPPRTSAYHIQHSTMNGLEPIDTTSALNVNESSARTPDSAKAIDFKVLKNLSHVLKLGIEQGAKESEDNEEPEVPWTDDTKVEELMLETIPDIQRCTFETFKNRLSASEPLHTIDLLCDSQNMGRDMADEQLKRLSDDDKKEWTRQPRKPRQRKANRKPDHTIRIERFRINSAYVLQYLGKAADEQLDHAPHTFLKPFDFLTHFHPTMEKQYESLAQYLGEMEDDTDPSSSSSMTPRGPRQVADDSAWRLKRSATINIAKQQQEHRTRGARAPKFDFPDEMMKTKKAYEDMRVYMKAMEPIITWYRFFETKDHNSPPKIHFDDLPALFRMGEIVYRPVSRKIKDKALAATQAESENAGGTLHRVWSLAFTSPSYIVDDLREEDGDLREDQDVGQGTVELDHYHLDHDGTEFRATSWMTTFSHWYGEKEITKLHMYPIRFAKNGAQIQREATNRGRRFKELLAHGHKPVRVKGWSLTTNPFGNPLEGDQNELIKHSSFIESEAIIDFAEAYQTYPWWKPVFLNGSLSLEADPYFEPDGFPFLSWDSQNRSKAMSKLPEIVFDDAYAMMRWRYIDYFKEDKFVVDPEERSEFGALLDLTDEDLSLLPDRIFCFSLRERKFFNMPVDSLSELQQGPDPFRDLQINPAHKDVIKAVLDQHFKRKDMIRTAERQKRELSLEQDIIQGKGRGLVLLLHGAPGVGKTATAEAIAQELKKPLLLITSADMGLRPEDVEFNLSQIFRLADRWDCVLLLDEADIFLSAREKKDSSLQRNALVSVFLRTLEYYPGVLFLTTNRPGVMDEAVKSRVHMIFKYPALGFEETMRVFELNLRMLDQGERDRAHVLRVEKMEIRGREIMDYAEWHFKEKPRQRWNGRQIRNAFQIARSLAHQDYENARQRGERDPRLTFTAKHLRIVAEATMAFDEYRQITIGKSDEEDAAARMERARDVPDYRSQTVSSYRTNEYRADSYSSRPRTPQPTSSYSYERQYSAPPAQPSPSPNPSFTLGGAARGSSTTPNPYGQERMATPLSHAQPQVQHAYSQPLPTRNTRYSDSPAPMSDYRSPPPPQADPSPLPQRSYLANEPLPPPPAEQPLPQAQHQHRPSFATERTYSTSSLSPATAAEQQQQSIRAPVPLPTDRAYSSTPPILERQQSEQLRQSMSSMSISMPPSAGRQEQQQQTRYVDEGAEEGGMRYSGAGYGMGVERRGLGGGVGGY